MFRDWFRDAAAAGEWPDRAGTRGAQAILNLRAINANGDFDQYWQWHQHQELRRNHLNHYQQLDLPA